MKLLILDNYDSFTYNLYQLAAGLMAESASSGDPSPLPTVLRNDQAGLDEIEALAPDRILISPGPGTPDKPGYFGICGPVIRELGPRIPILGVCLGHLGLAEVFGGRIVPTPAPRHGRSSPIRHAGASIFHDLPDPLDGMLYHSLVVERESLPDCLELTAWTDEGQVMGIQHREYPLIGLQFHPESIGTPAGKTLIRNFLHNDHR